jgi:hypothetical protein
MAPQSSSAQAGAPTKAHESVSVSASAIVPSSRLRTTTLQRKARRRRLPNMAATSTVTGRIRSFESGSNARVAALTSVRQSLHRSSAWEQLPPSGRRVLLVLAIPATTSSGASSLRIYPLQTDLRSHLTVLVTSHVQWSRRHIVSHIVRTASRPSPFPSGRIPGLRRLRLEHLTTLQNMLEVARLCRHRMTESTVLLKRENGSTDRLLSILMPPSSTRRHTLQRRRRDPPQSRLLVPWIA